MKGHTMRWSSMSKAQRASLNIMASTSKAGKLAMQTAKSVDRDMRLAREQSARGEMLAAVARYNGPVVKGEARAARGAGYTTARKATALPMNYFRSSSFGL